MRKPESLIREISLLVACVSVSRPQTSTSTPSEGRSFRPKRFDRSNYESPALQKNRGKYRKGICAALPAQSEVQDSHGATRAYGSSGDFPV